MIISSKLKVEIILNLVQELKKGWLIGCIHDCQSKEKISVLDHKPNHKLTDKRKEFIEKSLKVDENSLLQDTHRSKMS